MYTIYGTTCNCEHIMIFGKKHLDYTPSFVASVIGAVTLGLW